MLNGRFTDKNDFTSVSKKGLAVVDYAIVNQDYLHKCDGVTVERSHDMFTLTGLVGVCDPEHQCCQLGSFRMREILFFNIFNA